MARFDLSDAEWAIIAPRLPAARGRQGGRPRDDDRRVLNGIFHVLRTGQASDKARVADLLAGLPAAADLVADRGYDAQAIVDLITARGTRAPIPTQKDRRQRSVDRRLYRQRNLVERFFNKLKLFRRIATRCDKLARNYPAAIHPPPPACGCGLSPLPSVL